MKPSEKALIKAKRANKQLTGNKVKKIQRRKNIANQIKAFAILGGWTAITILLWFIKPAFAAFDPGLLNILKWGCTILSPVAAFTCIEIIIHPDWAEIKKKAKS
jgi:uncharacterized membrane protein YbaN (DUF454 family)